MGILILLAFAIFSALIAEPSTDVPEPASLSLKTASVNIGDVAVDIGYSTIKKLSATSGTVLWSVPVTNDGALAVDPLDLGVYTGYGNHDYSGSGTVYKYTANGSLVWTNFISVGGFCNFYYVSYAAVDVTSTSPGVVWTQTGCYGGIAKTSRNTGAQQWSVFTDDIGHASIDPSNGQIYDITNAGPQYNYDTIYSATANGNALNSAGSCEGYTDLNPADGMLYRGGDTRSSGCGLTLSQMDKAHLGATNWTLDLSSYISSFDALGVQPRSGGYVFVASAADSKIVVVNPATRAVVKIFATAIGANNIAVNPANGDLYITDGSSHFVYAYSPTGSLVWVSPDLGGPAGSIAVPRIVLAVSTGAPVVTTNAATNVASFLATLNGTVDPHGSTTSVYFQYGRTTSYGLTTARQTKTGNTYQDVSANISGLSVGTTYHFRIVASNSFGTRYGSDRTFTTHFRILATNSAGTSYGSDSVFTTP